MTRKEKIAVSLPAALVEAARRAVDEGRAANVSAYVAEALEQKSKSDDLLELLKEMRAEIGPPTPGETKWADEVLGRR